MVVKIVTIVFWLIPISILLFDKWNKTKDATNEDALEKLQKTMKLLSMIFNISLVIAAILTIYLMKIYI